jgi:hypothetical protein
MRRLISWAWRRRRANPKREETMSLGIPEIMILVVLFLGVVGTVFWIRMIIECATKESDPERLVWIIILVFTHFIGATIYYFVRRPARIAAGRA